MGLDNIVLELAIIFAGAAVLGTIFLYLRQPIILAYIALGALIGPWGMKVLGSAEHIERLSHVGIILLLFLLGLNLHPAKLLKLFQKTSAVTLGTSLLFMLLGMVTALCFGFGLADSAIIGAALMFSSTIVSLKLTPTTTLHQRHTGEMMISVLLFQDIIAILLILFLGGGTGGSGLLYSVLVVFKLAGLGAVSFVVAKFAIIPLFRRFDKIKEYFFVASLGWCLLMAELAYLIGLSYEMGAFIAGVTLASFPIALIIAESLKPLREFFLILFFFSIGARFDFLVSKNVLLPGLVLTAVLMLAKPLLFRVAFKLIREEGRIAKELGVRLGQASEFSLLVAYSTAQSGRIAAESSYLIQVVVMLTFVVSTYWVVFKYPTPISAKAGLCMD
ncbi:MAG: cation:proton antiporter [Kiritimatiellales bacterium]|nr:cation:proton antiporter [Kiritimatiellales bacterium]MCF7863906.1 cation:proton antiporter [Kiritimatiellales bacterium]